MTQEAVRGGLPRRRVAAGVLGLTLAAVGLGTPVGLRAQSEPAADHPLASFDQEVRAYMDQRGFPGGALAVVKDGRLVYARGYGWSDREQRQPVQPTSLFRIASISKPITAVAIFKLVEEGRLRLDARVVDLIKLRPVLPERKEQDPRWRRITVRHLLEHTGGWDRDRSYDPMFRSTRIAETTGTAAPAGPEAIIRYMLGQPLDFDPGTRYAYSNFGYCLLGRIIEQVTGKPYEQFVRRTVLEPMGITRMRIGASREEGRAVGEVRYYLPTPRNGPSVFPGLGPVSPPYGGFYVEAMDAHGGWIASAVDLARFAAALDAPRRSFLKPETLRRMYARPEPPVWRKEDGTPTDFYYGCGWLVRPVGTDGKANYWHNGSLPGTWTYLVRRADGLSWAILFNQRSDDPKANDAAIDVALHRAAAAVKEWPRQDLFGKYR